MEIWTGLMPRLEIGGSNVLSYDEGFLCWWRMQIPYIEDYPYTGMDFRNDQDLELPFGARWDATGITLKNNLLVNLKMFLFQNI